ncbi:MAG: hypothetical protein IPK03_00870 [Bacteroidetes bacterium]|nr:hypothetical protein [Bacteroidota bacterium]
MENQIDNQRAAILASLETKACLKQTIYKNTLHFFEMFKKTGKEIVQDLQPKISKFEEQVELEYKENGTYESAMKIAGDTIFLSMHSNVFNFEDIHPIHQSNYVKADRTRVYCGMIEIYNFLSDSLKYDRVTDVGYLIGRIFINKDNHFFVEGTRQLGFLYNDFENMILNEVYVNAIIENAILYSLEFDLWAPAFADVEQISLGEMIMKTGVTPHKTGKRLGFDMSNIKSSSIKN